MAFFTCLENVNNDISAEYTGKDKTKEATPLDSTVLNQFELESLTNMDLFIQKCLCVQYPRRKTSERACGGSRGLLLAIKARFDLCLPLGSTSALG